MLRWALIFLVVALVAAVLGFGGIAGSAAGIAKIIFGVFVILLIISIVMNMVRGKLKNAKFKKDIKSGNVAMRKLERQLKKL